MDISTVKARPSTTESGYRQDIDGLRALAVIPVILFHAGVAGLGGGYIGVDIFFVISGFLITGIIFREIGQQRFSISTFYKRRVRRIAPNLLVMLAVAELAAVVLLIPDDLHLFAESVIATIAFAANVLFYFKIDYFTPYSQQFPLLHMWSLGIEEQYYLIFPLILLLTMRISHRLTKQVIWGIALLSFLASVVMLHFSAQATFYLPFTRLWELMVGSLLSIKAVPALKSAGACERLAWCGLAAILVSIGFYTETTPFPGAAALLPCLGTAAIIHANTREATSVGRLLSWRPLVFVGLISYSLYIWHWPVIVFTRYLVQRPLSPVEIAVTLSLIAVLSIAAWRWVEQPMRSRSVSVRRLFTITACGTVLVSMVGAAILVTHGLPQRYSPALSRLALATRDINPDRARCDHPSLERLAKGDVCHVGPPGEPRFAMIGDSFGDAMAPGIGLAARDAGISGIIMTFSGCAPLPGVDEHVHRCADQVLAAYALVKKLPSIQRVVVIGRWPMMLSGTREGLFVTKGTWLVDRQSTEDGPAENVAAVTRGLLHAARYVAPAQLTIITGIPEQHVHVPQDITLRSLFGGNLSGLPRQAYERRQALSTEVLAKVQAEAGNIHVQNLGAAMCDRDHCPILADGRALYADDNHPSRTYAQKLAPEFIAALR